MPWNPAPSAPHPCTSPSSASGATTSVARAPRPRSRRARRPSSTPHSTPAITFFDTADIYGKEFGLSERMLGEALRGRRDGVIVATKFGHADWRRDGRRRSEGVARVHPGRGGGVARSARHRDDRPLSAAHARPVDADRRDARGARRARGGGQGARDRQLELLARPAGAPPMRQPPSTARPVSSPRRTSTTCSIAERRGRTAARPREPGHRLPALLPARQRPVHRQVHAHRPPRRHPDHAPAPARRRRRALGCDGGVRRVLRRARHLDARGDVRLVPRASPRCRA